MLPFLGVAIVRFGAGGPPDPCLWAPAASLRKLLSHSAYGKGEWATDTARATSPSSLSSVGSVFSLETGRWRPSGANCRYSTRGSRRWHHVPLCAAPRVALPQVPRQTSTWGELCSNSLNQSVAGEPHDHPEHGDPELNRGGKCSRQPQPWE